MVVTLFALFVLLKPAVFFAQEKIIETETPVGVEVAASISSVIVPVRVNYELPYPGMLPDHPLYFLKVARDGIVKRLINDDLKMARFGLLTAEKRMFAGKMLVDKKKDGIAIDAISKSNNYFNEAITAIKRYRKSHPKSTETRPFLHQLEASTLKRIEIAEDLRPFIDDRYKNQFDIEEKRMRQADQTAKGLLLL